MCGFSRNKSFLSAFLAFTSLLLVIYPRFCAAEGQKGVVFPFFPSLIAPAATGQKIVVDDFKEALSCRGCHLVTYKEWDGSPHSLAISDPVFLALWELADKEKDSSLNRFCLGCHTPVGVLTSAINLPEEVTKADKVVKQGVQCDFCHTVNGSNYHSSGISEPHNASVLVQPGKVKWGPIDNCKSTFHDSAFSELHTRAEFCGNCHNILLPETNLQIVKTYNEWEGSVYAEKGIGCQECHMMPVELSHMAADTLERQKNPGKGATVGGALRETIHAHEFTGGGGLAAKAPGAKSTSKAIEKRLKGAAVITAEMLPSRDVHDKYRLKVNIINKRAGHNLPTGMPGLRQVWVEVIVTDTAGKAVFRAGGVDANGKIQEGTMQLKAEGIDASGKFTLLPWKIQAIKSDTTIPAKGSGVFIYSIDPAPDAQWPLAAEVMLRYRAFPPAFLEMLFPASPPNNPIIEMATARVSIPGPGT